MAAMLRCGMVWVKGAFCNVTLFCYSARMVRILTIGLLLIGCSGCFDSCENDVASAVRSPDGNHVAIIFQRDCGATTGFTTQISVIDSDERLKGAGNVYVADDNHGVAAVGKWQGPWVELKWTSPNRLLVRYASKSRVFEQAKRIGGVAIDYQSVAR